MRTWFVTTVLPNSSGSYDQGVAAKLNQLQTAGHTIFSVQAISGGVQIVSYITGN
jgi:hypothetical protein